jgi:hypothetical protein
MAVHKTNSSPSFNEEARQIALQKEIYEACLKALNDMKNVRDLSWVGRHHKK